MFRYFWCMVRPVPFILALAAMLATGCASGGQRSAAMTTAEPAGSTTRSAPPTLATIVVTSPPAPTSAPPTTADESATVLEAYEEYRAARIELLMHPNSDSPLLLQSMTGQAREEMRRLVAEQLRERWVLVYPPQSSSRHTAKVDAVGGNFAELTDCVVDDSNALYPDGHLDNTDVDTSLFSVTLVKEAQRWKVLNRVRLDSARGISGCALQR